MKGNENGFAGALFFSLVGIGTLLKVDDIIAGATAAAIFALLAAICLRISLTGIAAAEEKRYQQNSIHLSQLAQQISDGFVVTSSVMQNFSDTANILHESLHDIRAGLQEFSNFPDFSDTREAFGAILEGVEDNTGRTIFALKEINDKIAATSEVMAKLPETLNENFAKLNAAVEENKIEPALKNLTIKEDMEKICATMTELLEKANEPDDFQKSAEEIQKEIAALSKIIVETAEKSRAVSDSSLQLEKVVREAATTFKEISEQLALNSEGLGEMFDDMSKDFKKLNDKLDTHNNLTEATLEQYLNLTEQDFAILKSITEKIHG